MTTRIDGDRLLGDLYALRKIGEYKTGVHRPTYSPEDVQSRHWLVDRMAAAGLEPENALSRHRWDLIVRISQGVRMGGCMCDKGRRASIRTATLAGGRGLTRTGPARSRTPADSRTRWPRNHPSTTCREDRDRSF